MGRPKKEKTEGPEAQTPIKNFVKQNVRADASEDYTTKVEAAVAATRMTRAQRAAQTEKFTAILAKQQLDGKVPVKSTANSEEKIKNREKMINVLAQQRVDMAEKGKII